MLKKLLKTSKKGYSASNKTNQESSIMTFRNFVISILQLLPIRVIAVGVIYMTGYWDINPLWVVIIWGIIKYRNRRRTEHSFKQEVEKAIAVRNDRKLLIANVNDLPSWVHFTDSDRCEWLNKAVAHVWPSIQPYVWKRIKSLEPVFNAMMSNYKKNPNFIFKDINLGSTTPRVTGIRVYNEGVSRFNRNIIDTHIFFPSDSIFYCSLRNVSFGVKDFQLKGRLRTIVSMSDTSYFPGVEICFIRQPAIKFDLIGLLNFGDFPVISGIVRNTVDSVIASRYVLPNKFVIKYHAGVDLEELKFPDPEGLLRVTVIEAKALSLSRRFLTTPRKPDPYVTITFGSKTFTSPSVKKSEDPVWNFAAEFVVDSYFDETITISVNDAKKGARFGELSLSLKLVRNKVKFKSWIQLEGAETGMVNLQVSYHKFVSNPQLLASGESPTILEVLIDDATNLANTKDNFFARLSVGGVTQSSRSVPVKQPVFREVFTFPVKDPKTDKLRIKLIKEKQKGSVGDTELDIHQLLESENMEVIDEKTRIKGGKTTCMLSVSMRLRSLTT